MPLDDDRKVPNAWLPKDANNAPMPVAADFKTTARDDAGTELTETELDPRAVLVSVWADVAIVVSEADSGGVTVPAGAVLTLPCAGRTNIYTASAASTADINILEELLAE